nr:hypothetical protein [Rhodospirillales bacterium]
MTASPGRALGSAHKPSGRNTTIEDAGYRGIPNSDIRCPDRHLADAEVISLGLKLASSRCLSGYERERDLKVGPFRMFPQYMHFF